MFCKLWNLFFYIYLLNVNTSVNIKPKNLVVVFFRYMQGRVSWMFDTGFSPFVFMKSKIYNVKKPITKGFPFFIMK